MIQSSYLTASQTVGPFFHTALLRAGAALPVLVGPDTIGERIRIEGHVRDGDGVGVPDALLELWQANSYGRYNHPSDTRALPLDPTFSGFGRTGTDTSGAFWFETIKPGPVPFDNARMQAPHLCVALFARGLLNHLYTRIYFADDPRTASDPILACVPDTRRHTLCAPRSADTDSVVYRFDIILQGSGETAFFTCAR